MEGAVPHAFTGNWHAEQFYFVASNFEKLKDRGILFPF